MYIVAWPLTLPIDLHYFFFNGPATTEIYTLSLHDALPISRETSSSCSFVCRPPSRRTWYSDLRSEEHTSELQSRPHLVCRLLLEKKKTRPPRERRMCPGGRRSEVAEEVVLCSGIPELFSRC